MPEVTDLTADDAKPAPVDRKPPPPDDKTRIFHRVSGMFWRRYPEKVAAGYHPKNKADYDRAMERARERDDGSSFAKMEEEMADRMGL